MFSDLGKNFQSSGFQSFISGMEKDVAPAAGAFHNLAGSVSEFIGDLQGKGAGAANNFLNGLASFGKAMAGPSSTGIVNSVSALTTLMHDATNVATNKQVSQGFDIISGLASFVTGHSVSSAGSVNSGIALGNAGLIPGSAGPARRCRRRNWRRRRRGRRRTAARSPRLSGKGWSTASAPVAPPFRCRSRSSQRSSSTRPTRRTSRSP